MTNARVITKAAALAIRASRARRSAGQPTAITARWTAINAQRTGYHVSLRNFNEYQSGTDFTNSSQ